MTIAEIIIAVLILLFIIGSIVSRSSVPSISVTKAEIVERAPFRVAPLLNREEAKVYENIARALISKYGAPSERNGFPIFPQVSMGAYLKTDDNDAWNIIARRRPDFLITTYGYKPLIVIEYQGQGRYQLGDRIQTEIGDALKKAATDNADLLLIRIYPDTDPETYISEIVSALDSYIEVASFRRTNRKESN